MANAATQPPMILPNIRQLTSCCTPTFRCQAVSPGPIGPFSTGHAAGAWVPRPAPELGQDRAVTANAPCFGGLFSLFRSENIPVPRLELSRGRRCRGHARSAWRGHFAPPQRLSPPPPPPGSPRRSAALVLRAARSAASRRMIQNAAEPPVRPGASPSANSGQAFEMRLRRCSRREGLQ